MTKKIAADLRFVGLHEDGEHLILATPDGTEHRLAITEMIRAAVRRDRPGLELLKGESEGFLPPREIQAQIRSGRTAEEVAERNAIALSMVRRYEGPVLAEREFMASQAGNTKLAAEPGSPTLGEIVTDRLAHRGVDISTLAWDAYRSEAHGWIIHASFVDDGSERTAQWTFDHHNLVLHALEAEARWLSETQISDAPIPRRLTAVPGAVYDVEQDEQHPAPVTAQDAQLAQTEALLEQLDEARGTPASPPEVAPVSSTPVARLYSLAPPETPAEHDALVDPPAATSAAPTTADSEHVPQPIVQQPNELAVPADAHVEAEATDSDLITEVFGATPNPKAVRKGKQRTRMPSWDEIMFGAKPE